VAEASRLVGEVAAFHQKTSWIGKSLPEVRRLAREGREFVNALGHAIISQRVSMKFRAVCVR
jgi:hypothetical protein